MTQQEKLQGLTEWLSRNGIDFKVYGQGERKLRIMGKSIYVFVTSPENEQECYDIACSKHCRAFFIRESEDMDFIIQKMRNCLKGLTVKLAQHKPPRKRVHIRKPIAR